MTTIQTQQTEEMIRYWKGSVIVLNLARIEREKKSPKPGEYPESWSADDETHLVVRIIYQGYPWILAHYGSREVLKAPLVLDMKKEDITSENMVTNEFRDFADCRGNQCIKRAFRFYFNSVFEAKTFCDGHNNFLDQYKTENKKKLEVIDEIKPNNVIESAKDRKSAAAVAKTESSESFDCALCKDFDLGDENNLLDDLNEYTQDPYESHAYNVNVPF